MLSDDRSGVCRRNIVQHALLYSAGIQHRLGSSDCLTDNYDYGIPKINNFYNQISWNEVEINLLPKVVSATKPDRALATSTGSTLAKNLRVLPLASLEAASSVRRASNTNSGPRSYLPKASVVFI